jgi:hypothetical protein
VIAAALSCISLLYFAFTLQFAKVRPFWYDELFTYYVSDLPDMGAIWSALVRGVDSNPPVFYFLTRLARGLVNDPEQGLRLPAVIGFWILSASLFAFIARRLGALSGLVAVLLLWSTDVYLYAFEARPYGIVLGSFGLALLCWQRATEDGRKTGWLFGLSASLATALLSHCYAILLLIPFAAGELVRLHARRRIDLPLWLALGLPCLAGISYLPLFQGTADLLQGSWARPNWGQGITFYAKIFLPAVLPLILTVCVAAFGLLVERNRNRRDAAAAAFHPHELAALVGLFLVPAFGVILAKFVTGIFATRYAISAGLVPCILVGALASATIRRRWGVAMTVVLLGLFMRDTMSALRSGSTPDGGSTKNPATILAGASIPDDGNPIVIPAGLHFVEIAHYADDNLRKRLLYVRHPELALKYTGANTLDRGLPRVRQWFPQLKLTIIDYDDFVRTRKHFWVYGQIGDKYNWLLPELISSGARLELRHRTGSNFVIAGELK